MYAFYLYMYWKEKETHINVDFHLYQRCIFCVNEIEFELDWLFNVTCNDISVIYVTAHVQADWRRGWTYGRAPNAIDIS